MLISPEAITVVAPRHVLLITTEARGNPDELQDLACRYERMLVAAIGQPPPTFWLRCRRLLGILHLLDSVQAADALLSCQPIANMFGLPSVDRSIFVQQFDVLQVSPPALPEVTAMTEEPGDSLADVGSR